MVGLVPVARPKGLDGRRWSENLGGGGV
jgi:hypothetical protein